MINNYMNIINYMFNPKNINSLGLIFLFLMREFTRKPNLLYFLFYLSGLSILNYFVFIYNYWIPLKIKKITPKILESNLSSQISVLWYNTYSLPFLTSRIHHQAVISYIHNCLSNHNVNVIGLGEVWLNRDVQYISKYVLEMLGPHWKVYISSKNHIIGDGIIIFWNSNELHIGTIFSTKYTSSAGIESFVSKGFVSSVITPFKFINNKKVISNNLSQKIIFTHMQDFVDTNSTSKSIIHALQFKQLHSSIIYNHPTFIIGDLNFEFNMTPNSCHNLYSKYLLVPTLNEFKNGKINFNSRATCYNYDRPYSFDYVLKEKFNPETTARFHIIRDLNIKNPSDHQPIIFTIF